MLALTPIRSEKIWGYEDWIASTFPGSRQDDFAELAGDFPLLVKIIQANDTLSVQVHPDDATAAQLEGAGACGKTECWYVLDAAPGAQIVYGLKKNCTTEELRQAIQTNTLESKLHCVSVQKGDFAFIPAGSVHAIGGGLRLLEVQQSCDITYRLYDWGRPRALHVEKGLASVRHAERAPIAPMQDTFSCAYFSLQKRHVSDRLTLRCEKSGQLVFIAEGNGTIAAQKPGGSTQRLAFQKEQMFALAAGEDITVSGTGDIIVISAP
ncbi:MAG: class I mannose-6-phosphate isomerase [Treponemataceae bacterium]|nr:class I mannose-6-phosphate isomerase [Treponemataceae bacterium]